MIAALWLLPERKCETCTAVTKKRWGCETDALEPLEMDGEILLRCPRRPMLDFPGYYQELLNNYAKYKQGWLPEDGGFLSQPHKLMELFAQIDIVSEECREIRDQRKAPQGRGTSAPTRKPSRGRRL